MYGYVHNSLEKSREVLGMNNSDWNNPRRLIRKIEILTNTNKYYPILTNTNKLNYLNLAIIGLTAPLSTIKQNIERRVQERLDKGLLGEIKGLVREYGWNEVLRNTIAYKEWEDFFNGKITREQVVTNWTKDEFNYAKRQLTWFRKDRRVVWLNKDYLKGALELINSSYLLY
jgi:tRNA dimethylallyltransferase